MINSKDGLVVSSETIIKESSLYKKPEKVYSSTASSTYLSITKLRKTLPEFSTVSFASEIQLLRYSSRYVALELMALWVPRYQNNPHNYMRRYIHTTDNLREFSKRIPRNSGYAMPYYNFEPDVILQAIKEKRVCNLGSLLYLNILLGGTLSDTNLQIIKSPENIYYFVLNQEEDFFYNFFNNNLAKYESFFDSIKSLNHMSWWEIILGDEVLVKHQFIEEIYETAFRVYATSDELISFILSELLGKEFKFFSFNTYLIALKKQSISILYSYLTNIECSLITNLKKDKGSKIVKKYLEDYKYFIQIYSLFRNMANETQRLWLLNIEMEIYYASYQISLPWILTDISSDDNNICVSDLTYIISSTLFLIKNKWQLLSAFPDYPVWGFLNSVARYINNFYSYQKITEFDPIFFIPLFVCCAKNNLNDMCKLLLREHPYVALSTLVNNSYINHIFYKFLNNSICNCIKDMGNHEIFYLIKNIKSQTNYANIVQRPRSNAIGTAEDLKNFKHIQFYRNRIQRSSITEEELHKPRLQRAKSVLEDLNLTDSATVNSNISTFNNP